MKNDELLNKIVIALQDNDINALISLLAESPATQREEIMGAELPGYPGVSPFMALVAMVGTLGIEPLNALIKDAHVKYLVFGMMDQYPAIRQKETEFSRILDGHAGKDAIDIIADTVGAQDDTLRNALVNNFSNEDDQRKVARLIVNRVKERQALKKEQEEALAQQEAETIVSTTSQTERNYAFENIVELLSSEGLYEHNKNNIDQLNKYPDYTSDRADCSSISSGLNYLKKINLLNQETLTVVLKIIETPGTALHSWDTVPAFNSDAFRLLAQLDQYEIAIDKPELDIIFSMKQKNLERLSDVISQLNNAKLLDKNSLSQALEKVNDKLPTAEPIHAEKVGRDKATSQRSEIKLGNQGVSIFPEPTTRESQSKSEPAKGQIAGALE